MYKPRYRRRQQKRFSLPSRAQIISFLPKFVFFSLILGTVLGVFLIFWYSRNLPDPNTIQRRDGFSTQILDRSGNEVLYNIYENENRRFTPLQDIPQDLKHATVAIEDKDFYKHQGFDPLGYLRIVKNIFTRGRVIGGSTLTQQLVKNVLLTNERTVTRKIKEFILALQIERKFSKDEILTMYLNEAPYGGTAWGIAAASQAYFGKDPKDLTLLESVILAGMPQSPSRFSPYSSNPLAYVDRSLDVARRMREDGYITKEQEDDIKANLTNVEFKSRGSALKAPHFVMYVKDQLEQMYGQDLVERGGLKVTTTLDWELQNQAQDIVKEEIDDVSESLHITNGGSIILDTNTGEILSMVGSADFYNDDIDGQYNVTLGLRQPGSAIKPVTYATAFAKGYYPGKVLADTVTEFPSGDPEDPYIPLNYDNKEHGLVHLRDALGSSLNIPAVKLLSLVGVRDMLDTAYNMGLSTLAPTNDNLKRLGLSVTLGGGEVHPLELASAYSAFANGGLKVDPVSILKVEDKNGKVLYEYQPSNKKRVLDEKVAFLINNILSDNNARLITFGVNSLLNIRGQSVAVKTGTTNDRRDNWAIGWTKDNIVAVWVGNSDNTAMKQVASGVSGASPIWRREMLDVLSKYPAQPFNTPSGVEQVDLDTISGYPAHDDFPSYQEWVVPSTLPTTSDPIHMLTPICPSDNGKLASPVQIAQGNYDTKEYIFVKEQDPLTPDDLWQKGIDAWLASVDDDRFHPPSETCDDISGLHVEINNPKDRSRIDSNQVDINVSVYSDQKVQWVDLYLDGNKELRWESRPYEKTFTLDDGVHEIRVVAHNEDGRESDRVHVFGVNAAWDSDQNTSE